MIVYHRTVMVWAMNVKGTLPLDCLFDPVLGFADAGDVFPVVEADFDGPPGRVAGDDLAAVAVMSVDTIAMS